MQLNPVKVNRHMTRNEVKNALRNYGLELPNGVVVVSPSSVEKRFGVKPTNKKRVKIKTAASYYTPVVVEVTQ